MKCSKLLEELEMQMPLSLAMDWDNPGLLAGREDKEIKRVFLTLDITTESLKKAASLGSDLILTHHPLLFHPIKTITTSSAVGRLLLQLLQADMCHVAMHTNYDVAPGCMGDLCADLLGLKNDREVLEETGVYREQVVGVGAVGNLPEEMSLEKLAAHVKERFDISFVQIYGAPFSNKTGLLRAAISPGSGKGMYRQAHKKGAQVLITGDITHHEALLAMEEGLCVIDGGHYGIEKIFIKDMEDRLLKLDGKLETFCFFPGLPGKIE